MVRLPPSPSSMLTSLLEPCEVIATIRSMFVKRSPPSMAGLQTRSIQPFNMAGCPAHHVG